VRIILRTGQPGQAPEMQVIREYNINDYKEKTELTAQKLVTTILTAIRGYRDIQIIDTSRRGLEQIVRSSAALFSPRSLALFAQGVLQQVTSLFNLDEDSVYLQSSGFTAVRDSESFQIIAGTGRYEDCAGKSASEVNLSDLQHKLDRAIREQRTIIDADGFLGYYRTSGGSENVVYVRRRSLNSVIDDRLLEVLSTNLAVAFDNIHLNREVRVTQEELIRTLSEVVETRSQEVSHHVDRVAAIAALLGTKQGLSEEDVELIRIAAPMHDLGKIGIPDAILCKPGRYDESEIEVIRTHPDIGFAILKASCRPSLLAASTICLQHHEHWDGGGYPKGLKGENIHVFGRIVALADVLDALTQERAYKPAWPMERVIGYIRDQRGKQFDPVLVDLFLEHLDEFVAALSKFPSGSVC
jgi:response regulator RpfG family c-di-GMP phosphodiesterase